MTEQQDINFRSDDDRIRFGLPREVIENLAFIALHSGKPIGEVMAEGVIRHASGPEFERYAEEMRKWAQRSVAEDNERISAEVEGFIQNIQQSPMPGSEPYDL